MFKDGDLIKDGNIVYKVVQDGKCNSCNRCDFFKNKTREELGIPCSELLYKRFKYNIDKLLIHKLIGPISSIQIDLMDFGRKKFTCQDLFGNDDNYDGAHLERVNRSNTLLSWKKITIKED